MCKTDIFNVYQFCIIKSAFRNQWIQSIYEKYEFKREKVIINKSNGISMARFGSKQTGQERQRRECSVCGVNVERNWYSVYGV